MQVVEMPRWFRLFFLSYSSFFHSSLLQHLDDHKCFHPPFNAAVIGGGIIVAWVIGYGSMAFGMYHQQTKQGFWK
jgi:hypothetical protein